jgi:DNA-binding MarR family transcriptional regulator
VIVSHDVASLERVAPTAPATSDAPPSTGSADAEQLRLLVARGVVDPARGHLLVNTLLEPGPAGWPLRVYDALRAWTGRTLSSQHRHAGTLRGWAQVLQRAATLMQDDLPEQAARLRGFHELLRHALLLLEHAPSPESVLKRKHVGELLKRLALIQRPVSRGELARHLDTSPQNVSRLMDLLDEVQAIERHVAGREALYALTSEGRALAAKSRPVKPDAPQPSPVPPRLREGGRPQRPAAAFGYRRVGV